MGHGTADREGGNQHEENSVRMVHSEAYHSARLSPALQGLDEDFSKKNLNPMK